MTESSALHPDTGFSMGTGSTSLRPLQKNECLVIWIDDDPHYLSMGERFLHLFGNIEIDFFSNPLEALRWIGYRDYAVIITDYHLPAINGLELLSRVESRGIHIPSIILSCDRLQEIISQTDIPKGCMVLYKGEDPYSLFYNLYLLIMRLHDNQI